MDFSKYTVGKGIDVSRHPSGELAYSNVHNLTHLFIEPNNFYSFREHIPYESLQFIFSENLINETKFYPILLKEWFYFCKVGGHILIKSVENGIIDSDKLKRAIKIFLGDGVKIVEEFNGLNKEFYFAIQKVKPALDKNDSVDKWSFGILTMKGQDEGVDDEITSIKKLDIQNYEIIINGNYDGLYKKDRKVRIIPFDEEFKPGWITRKKNIIIENSQYENVVVTHNKFIFDENWHKGIKKYGNYFEVLSCKILTPKEKRAGDWLTYGTDWNKIARIGMLEYKDWDKYGYVDGGFYILKKSVWRKVKWNENVLWGQGEDIVLSQDWEKNGIVTRFNSYSDILATNWNHEDLQEYKFNAKKLGNLKKGRLKLIKYVLKQGIKTYLLGKNKLHSK